LWTQPGAAIICLPALPVTLHLFAGTLALRNAYERFLLSAGLRIGHDIIKDQSLWSLAARRGPHFVTDLQGFQATRAGYASGNFVYGLFAANLPGA